MYKLFAVWTHPDDVEAFERHYVEVHAPLAAAIPGLRKLVLTRTADSLGEGPSPFHRIAELWFEDEAGLAAGEASAEGQAAIADAAAMQERFGAKLMSPAGTAVDQPLLPSPDG
ncbi:MAG TPA: EthD family reductase [Solirubrobacterales bacterium]|jgi:uncharacterized protein (TIGR02118 family)|nr:EthD family reductase [Solirubrobacterales bacterium]